MVGERSQLGKERLSRAEAETEKVGGVEVAERVRCVPGVVRVVSGKWMRRGARMGELGGLLGERERMVSRTLSGSFGMLVRSGVIT